jgi:large subunit ribosomal protein L24
MKLRVGDTVKVLLGKDKGREGKIEIIFPKKGLVAVPGVNIYKKHVKKSVARDGKGGIFEIPRPIPVAKVALVCPKCKKTTRIGFKLVKGGKQRFCRKCQKLIDKNAKA